MKRVTPMRAIRLKCLDCCCQQRNEVKFCRITTCALWPFRPFQKRTPKPGNPDRKAPNMAGLHRWRAEQTHKT